jgi:uncharacterized Ntn-hydrolase superfamily protein
MTFSLVGRCRRTGMIGAVVSSSSPAVAARCIWARAGVGAVCSQSLTDPALRDRLLERVAAGASAPAAVEDLVRDAEGVTYRQLAAIDAFGRGATYSGTHTLGRYADAVGADCAAAGNLLADRAVIDGMVSSFVQMEDASLGDRLVAALRAGLVAGGEEAPVHSAGLVIVDAVPWPVTDLRVDWTEGDPTKELERLWERWKPLADGYLERALHPSRAPRTDGAPSH